MTSQHVVCTHCDSTNKTPVEKNIANANCGKCHQPLFSGTVYDISSEQFEKQVKRNTIPVIADFWADWCQPCKILGPVMTQVANELEPAYRFVKIDTDKYQSLAGQYAIRGIPTIILFNNGSEISRQSGAMDGNSLKSWISNSLK